MLHKKRQGVYVKRDEAGESIPNKSRQECLCQTRRGRGVYAEQEEAGESVPNKDRQESMPKKERKGFLCQ